MKILVQRVNWDVEPLEIEFEEGEVITIGTLKEKILEKVQGLVGLEAVGHLEVKIRYLNETQNNFELFRDGTIVGAEIWESRRVW